MSSHTHERLLLRWRRITAYLTSSLRVFHRRIIPPGSRVLQPRCGTGEWLASVEPERGVGLETDPFFAELCRTRHPELEILEQEITDADPRKRFDYVIACHLLEQEDECLETVKSISEWTAPRGKIVFTFLNPLWAPVVKFFISLGIRPRDRRYNYLTTKDVENLCLLSGLAVVEGGYKVFCPLPIPLIAPFLNLVLARIPVVRNFGLIGYVIARSPREDSHERLSVSVIIPCHNEEDNITECIGRTPRMGRHTEIVVVNDGSTDRTESIVTELAREIESIRLVSYESRKGKAHAVKCGFEKASGDIVMILDADMTVAPEELISFYHAMEEDRAEFINGTRMIYPQEIGAFTLWRLVGNKLFGILFSVLIGQRCTDTLCGTKVLYRTDVRKMELSGKGWGDFDLLFGVASRKLHMLELPVHYRERKAGKSKMRFFRDGIRLTYLCLRAAVKLP
jgi:hypothetical protein